MSSHDLRFEIERYPSFDEFGQEESCSWGCPEFGLMGYSKLNELFNACLEFLNNNGFALESKYDKEVYDFNEYQVRNGLRKHWSWLRHLNDHRDIADFVIAHGRRPMGTIYNPRFTWHEWQIEDLK